MNELFFHECRAAGLVFKTSNDWFKWLTENSYDIKKPVAEHDGFKYNIKDICINPHVIEYAVDGVDNWGWKVMTANTQFGWIWGYSIQKGSMVTTARLVTLADMTLSTSSTVMRRKRSTMP